MYGGTRWVRGWFLADEREYPTESAGTVTRNLHQYVPQTPSYYPATPGTATYNQQQYRLMLERTTDPFYSMIGESRIMSDSYSSFTNFAPFPVERDGKYYPTAEHLFQAYKFIGSRADIAECIRTKPGPRAALEETTRNRHLQRQDWFNVNIRKMQKVLKAKFTQNPVLRDLLLSTGNRELVEASPSDSFWGVGPNGDGRNELGKALMRLRAEFQAEEYRRRAGRR